MKSNCIKAKFNKGLGLLLCLTILQVRAFAGGSSGNGNGDSAFALQELADKNPTLSPQEILLKAFAESAGRIPKIDWKNNWELGSRIIRENEDYSVFTSDFGGRKGIVIISLAEGAGKLNYPSSGISLMKHTYNNGKLLPSHDKYFISFNNFQNYYFLKKLSSETGLVFAYISYDPKNLLSSIEFRSFDDTTVIFVSYPYYNADTKTLICDNNAMQLESKNKVEVPPETKICSVGYFWTK